MLFVGLLIAIRLCGITFSSGSVVPVNNSEPELLRYLFSNYSPEVRPVMNNWDPVTVKLGVKLKQIINVDEKNQFITTNLWIRQYWKNSLLTWDPAKFGGVKSINIDPRRVWTPDILLYNPAGTDQNVGSLYKIIDTKVIISHTGQVTWLSPAIVKTECKIDVLNFPFDEQRCPLQFGSWTYNGLHIDIQPYRSVGMDTEKFSVNREWHLVGAPGVRDVTLYNCCPAPYITLTFTIIIRRRAMFYLYNLIIPCAMIALLSLCSFYLPPDSGERVGFVITVLLAMCVFMLMITEKMPQSADIPLASKFFMAGMMQIAISLAATCIVIKNYHSKGPIRPIIYLLVNNWLAKLVFMKPWKSDTSTVEPNDMVITSLSPTLPLKEKEVTQNINGKSTEMETLTSEVKVLLDKVREDAGEQKHRDDWMFAALVLDRFFLITFSLTLLLTCFGVFIQTPSNSTVF